mmetsp:Transcript_99621/g.321178  ORF Transcript_99621/g.321178 Transcript_99621/m.321178 type:complete len:368 (-) Transcript_99621:464-1567(-)
MRELKPWQERACVLAQGHSHRLHVPTGAEGPRARACEEHSVGLRAAGCVADVARHGHIARVEGIRPVQLHYGQPSCREVLADVRRGLAQCIKQGLVVAPEDARADVGLRRLPYDLCARGIRVHRAGQVRCGEAVLHAERHFGDVVARVGADHRGPQDPAPRGYMQRRKPVLDAVATAPVDVPELAREGVEGHARGAQLCGRSADSSNLRICVGRPGHQQATGIEALAQERISDRHAGLPLGRMCEAVRPWQAVTGCINVGVLRPQLRVNTHAAICVGRNTGTVEAKAARVRHAAGRIQQGLSVQADLAAGGRSNRDGVGAERLGAEPPVSPLHTQQAGAQEEGHTAALKRGFHHVRGLRLLLAQDML